MATNPRSPWNRETVKHDPYQEFPAIDSAGALIRVWTFISLNSRNAIFASFSDFMLHIAHGSRLPPEESQVLTVPGSALVFPGIIRMTHRKRSLIGFHEVLVILKGSCTRKSVE